MAEADKKLVLVFPPFSTASSPPLGVCTLKGYVARNVPGWSAKVVDLNLRTYEKIIEFVARGRYLDPRSFQEGMLGEIALSRASEVFRGKNDEEFYNRPDRYTIYADLFLRAAQAEVGNYPMLQQAYAGAGRMPPLIEEYTNAVVAESPDAVGVSLCYSHQFWFSVCLAKALKKKTKAPVIFGGTFFGQDSGKFLQQYADAMDFIITGEGELGLKQLLSNMDAPADVPGLVYQSGDGVKTNPPEFEKDLDSLGHPDFSDLDLSTYYSPESVVPVLTSRGCYWRKCAFCVHYKSAGQTYRTYSVEHVVEELKSHVDAGVTNFSLVDEMISPKRFGQIADGIVDAGLDIRYYALAKPVKQFTRPLLEKMYASGCRYLLWGMESGSQRMLDLMCKGTRVDEMREVFRTAHEAGLANHVYVMFGFPTETLEELLDTLRFLDANKDAIYAVHRGIFHLMKGSPVYDDLAKFSVTRTWEAGDPILRGWYEFECSSGMSMEEVRQAFPQILPFLRAFNPYSTRLGNFRDHALLIYSKLGDRLDAGKRRFPPCQITRIVY